VRYSAFGEIRASTGTTVTDKKYTGQQQESEIGLDYYVARFYDPVTAHFIQADMVISNPFSSLGWNRYSYVINNPIRYTDPSGRKQCDVAEGDCGRIKGTQIAIENHISKIYDTSSVLLTGTNWNLKQVVTVSRAIYKIIKSVDNITSGKGQQWVKKNLGGTTIDVGKGIFKDYPYVMGSTIHLVNNFENMGWHAIDYSPTNQVIHEFGHILDNKLAGHEATWFGGGPGDWLLDFVGGKSTAPFRWVKGLQIPDSEKFAQNECYNYGNTTAADYFAHAFMSVIVAPDDPDAPLKARLWVTALIDLTQ
jgi:RHS repeat-associated protein